MALTCGEIAERVGGTVRGPLETRIESVETLDRAGPRELTFIGNEKFAGRWAASHASAALVEQGLSIDTDDGRPLIFVDGVDLAMAQVLEALAPAPPVPAEGVHPTATVAASASLGADVRIGPGCTVGERVRLGEGTVLHSNVTILDETCVGEGSVFWPGTVVRERCEIGERAIVHPNVTVGSDGFGYRPSGGGLVKLPQIGTVRIGRDVEIGAGTCIDRGKFSATEIGDGTKLDNLVQIAHNCRIGRGVVIAAQTGLAGSVTVEDGAVLGGKVGIRDHVTVGAGAELAAYAAVMEDVPAGATWLGYPAHNARDALREMAAVRKLPNLVRRLKE